MFLDTWKKNYRLIINWIGSLFRNIISHQVRTQQLTRSVMSKKGSVVDSSVCECCRQKQQRTNTNRYIPRTTSTSLFSCWAGRAAGQPGLICWPTRLLCEKNDWFPKILVPKNESNRATAVPVVVGTLYSRKRVKCKAKVHIITDLSAVVTEPSPSMSGRSLSTPPLALLKSVQKKNIIIYFSF